MVFILYKLYVLLPYTYPTPKLSPHRRRCISIFPPKNSLCMIYKHFKLWEHWKCPHKPPSPCNTYVIPVIIQICVLINHINIHTHTHTHTQHTLLHTLSHTHHHTHNTHTQTPHSHTHTHSHRHTHTHTHSHTHTHTDTHRHTTNRTHPHTHHTTHTHTHSQMEQEQKGVCAVTRDQCRQNHTRQTLNQSASLWALCDLTWVDDK